MWTPKPIYLGSILTSPLGLGSQGAYTDGVAIGVFGACVEGVLGCGHPEWGLEVKSGLWWAGSLADSIYTMFKEKGTRVGFFKVIDYWEVQRMICWLGVIGPSFSRSRKFSQWGDTFWSMKFAKGRTSADGYMPGEWSYQGCCWDCLLL